MTKILISLPDNLALRMKAAIQPRQRSLIIARLIEKEIEERENALYQSAMAVEKEESLRKEMQDWDTTLQDGLEDETW